MSLLTTDEENKLLRAVLDAPADDGPRLVLADALQSRGEAFGEYIALEVKLAQAAIKWDTWAWNSAGGARGLRETSLVKLLDEVLGGERDSNGVDLDVIRLRRRVHDFHSQLPAWLTELVPGVTEAHWHRGFPTEVTITGASLLAQTRRLRSPVASMEITEGRVTDPLAFVAHQWVRSLRSLHIHSDTYAITAPIQATGPTDLRELRLDVPTMRPETLMKLEPSFEHLERLVAPACTWFDEDFDALLRAPKLREVTLERGFTDLPMSEIWHDVLEKRQLTVHFETTRVTPERFTEYLNEHSTWAKLEAFLRARQPAVNAPSGGARWGRYRLW